MNLSHVVIYIMGCLLFSTCLDPIEFDVPAGLSDSVVIQGRVVKSDTSFVEVVVSKLFDFSPTSRQPVRLNEVKLINDSGKEMILKQLSPGFYKQVLDDHTPIQARVGTGYKIEVKSSDGRKFESDFDFMPLGKQPQRLLISLINEETETVHGLRITQDKLELKIDTKIPNTSGEGIYWELNVIYKLTDSERQLLGLPIDDIPERVCYIKETANVNEVYVLDPNKLNSEDISNYELLVIAPDVRAKEGLYFELTQNSLSPGAFEYWSGVDMLSERKGTMFDGPVGQVKTNIINVNDKDDFVFGYFFASDQRKIRKKLDPSLIPQFEFMCPPERDQFCVTHLSECICQPCCNCLLEPNSTTTKPTWWVD